MKAFRFRADTLLTLRRRNRDAAKTMLALAERALLDATADVERATAAEVTATARYAAEIAAARDPEVFERHRNWIAALQVEVQRAQIVLDDRKASAASAAEAVRLAHQGVRILERLRERAVRRYDADVRRTEIKDIDQLATLQYARRLVSGGTDSDR